MTIDLSGVLLPTTTPFTPDEALDPAGLTSNIGKWSRTEIKGFVVLGSTGERLNLDEQEYVRVIELARRSVPETMTFIVGAGQQSTRGTIAEIERAAQGGADAVLVITPNFYKSAITQEALINHYEAVADQSNVPVILYSMPDLTGVVIEPETAARLSEHQNIIAMKDSSNEIARFAKTVSLVKKDFAMLIGNGTVFFEALQAGAQGGILAVGCCAAEICIAIDRAVAAAEFDLASTLQLQLMPLARAVTRTYGIGGLKCAMDMAGYVGGTVRAPLRRPNEAGRAEIRQMLHDLHECRKPDRKARLVQQATT
jgi:4-hydroxy-2-oxoglutarate aldolase